MDLMIDIETLGNETNTVVLSIGAVFFSIKENKLLDSFITRLSIDDQIEVGRKVNSSTIKWWLDQSHEAQVDAFNLGKFAADIPTRVGLECLSSFIADAKKELPVGEKLYVWGNGSSFDISILESLYRDFKLPVPWSYSSAMDLRTFKRFVAGGQDVDKLIGIAHTALDDAENQAKYVLKHLNK